LAAQVPEGLEVAVGKMEEGQRSIITITDPELAYGSQGYKGALAEVPSDSGVVFDLTMTHLEKAKEKWSMNMEEKVRRAGNKVGGRSGEG
jgi:hypothetical protein